MSLRDRLRLPQVAGQVRGERLSIFDTLKGSFKIVDIGLYRIMPDVREWPGADHLSAAEVPSALEVFREYELVSG